MSANNSLFYALVLCPLYLLLGPWAVGYFLEDSLGILFFWGVYVEDRVLPAPVASIIALLILVPYIYTFIIFVVLFTGVKSPGRKVAFFFFTIFMSCQIFHTHQVYVRLGFLESLGVLGLTRIVYFCFLFYNMMTMK